MSVVISCLNDEIIIYNQKEEKKEIKLEFNCPAYIVSRAIYSLTNNRQILCSEMDSMETFYHFVNSIATLSASGIFLETTSVAKNFNDLIHFKKWIQGAQVSIISNFTKENKSKTSTKIKIIFPCAAHLPFNNGDPIAQHCYQFFYKCIREANFFNKMVKKEVDKKNQYFEFTLAKEVYCDRGAVETAIDFFLDCYHNHFFDKLQITWTINKVDKPFLN
jgi:hypothetical protein